MKHRLIPFCVLLVLTSGPTAQPQEPARKGPDPAAFRLARIERVDLANTLTFDGVLRPVQLAQLHVRSGGTVEKIFVRQGDLVKRGDLLLQIDPRGQDLALELARATLLKSKAEEDRAEAQRRLAEADLARADRLYMLKTISEEEFFRIRGQFENARGRSGEARANVLLQELAVRRAQLDLESTRLVAPFDGIVQELSVEVGELALPTTGRVILLASSPDTLIFRALLGERAARELQVGMPLTVGETRTKIESLTRVLREGEEFPRVALEARVANPAKQGTVFQKVAAEVPLGKLEGVLTVPAAALQWRPLPEEVDPAAREAYREFRYAPPPAPAGLVVLLIEGRLRPVQVEVIGSAGAVVAIRGPVMVGATVVVGRKGLE